jgi:hypothetical protein
MLGAAVTRKNEIDPAQALESRQPLYPIRGTRASPAIEAPAGPWGIGVIDSMIMSAPTPE